MRDEVEELLLVPFRADAHFQPESITEREWGAALQLSRRNGYAAEASLGMDRRAVLTFSSALKKGLETLEEPIKDKISSLIEFLGGYGRLGFSVERRWKRAMPRRREPPPVQERNAHLDERFAKCVTKIRKDV